MDVKEEIDVKDEPLDFEEEDVEKNQFFEHISGLDESQVFIMDQNVILTFL